MHFYDERIARDYGVPAAVLLQNIYFWCQKNKANGHNLHDGLFWTYNSEKAFSELFVEFTKWQVRNALKKLQEEGLIVTGNYNNSQYDRTLWYAVTEKAEKLLSGCCESTTSKLQNCNMEIGENQNGNCRNATPIPDINTDKNFADINTDENKDGGKPPARTKKPKETKESFGEYRNVKLSLSEHQKLQEEYGEAETAEAIIFLDEYIEEKGTKYKSHYLAMRRWVFDAVQERNQKKKKAQQSGGGRLPNGGYDWDSL